MKFFGPTDRINNSTGFAVINNDGSITITPAAGQNTTLSSGQFLVPNGTPAAPPFSFTNDPDIGFYRHAADTLGLTAPTAIVINNGQLQVPNGAVATPSIAFTNDPDTGLYRHATDVLGLAAPGSIVFNHGGTIGLVVTPNRTTTTTGSNASSQGFWTDQLFALGAAGGAADFAFARQGANIGKFTNAGATDYFIFDGPNISIAFGGTTASFPRIKRASSSIVFEKADGSGNSITLFTDSATFPVTVGATGADADIDLQFQAKGTGSNIFLNNIAFSADNSFDFGLIAGGGLRSPRDMYFARQTRGPDGSAGAPAYSFLNGLTRGLFNHSTNGIGVSLGGTQRFIFDPNGNVVAGTAALATNATDGFIYQASCAGLPTGVPTAYTGRVPEVFDSTNKRKYAYSAGWVLISPTSISTLSLGRVQVGASTTAFGTLFERVLTTDETTRSVIIPAGITVTNLYLITTTAQPASGSLVVTVRKNGADTGITFTVAAGAAAGTFSDTAHSASFAAGDKLSISLVNNATASSAELQSLALQYTMP